MEINIQKIYIFKKHNENLNCSKERNIINNNFD